MKLYRMSWQGNCSGSINPTLEICDNGVDDNCDGQIDDPRSQVVSFSSHIP